MDMTDVSEITKAAYQSTARIFADNVADLAPRESIEKFIDLLPENPTIIDIGCGSGRDAKLFTDLGADVTGIDFASHLLDIAKTHAPSAKFYLKNIESMDFPPASFDGVWSACSLGHMPKAKLPAIFSNIHAILKPSGYFYLALKKGAGEGLEADTRYEGSPKKYWAYYEEDELRSLLQKAGFSIVDLAFVEKNHAYQTAHGGFRVFCRADIL